MSMSSEGRQYTETEVRQILEQAAHLEARGNVRAPATTGYSLADVREIARLAGINPAGVDSAVLAPSEPEITTRFAGVPLTFQLDATVTRRLMDAEVFGAASAADRVMGEGGEIRQGSNWLEWHNKRKASFVGVTWGNEQTRIRIIMDHTRSVAIVSVLSGVFVVPGILEMMVTSPSGTAAAATVLTVGGLYGIVRGYAQVMAIRTRRRIRRILGDITDDISSAPM